MCIRDSLDTYEATHNYDEYHFYLDEIEHDPYVPVSYTHLDVYKRQPLWRTIWHSPIGAARPTPDRKERPPMRTLYLRPHGRPAR